MSRAEALKGLSLHGLLALSIFYPAYFLTLFAADTWLGSRTMLTEFLFDSKRRMLGEMIELVRDTMPFALILLMIGVILVRAGPIARISRLLGVLIAATLVWAAAGIAGYDAMQCGLYAATILITLAGPLALKSLRRA